MPKQPKQPFSSIHRPTDAQLADMQRGHPFKKCICGNSIAASQKFCYECRRLYDDLGMHTPPVGQFVQANNKDAQERQSYPSDKHSGYSDSISHRKIDPTRERY